VTRVELEEDELGEEETRHPGDIGIDEEVCCRRSEGIVETEVLDVDTEQNAAHHEEDVIDGELFRDGVVERGGAGGGGVKSCEGVGEEL